MAPPASTDEPARHKKSKPDKEDVRVRPWSSARVRRDLSKKQEPSDEAGRVGEVELISVIDCFPSCYSTSAYC